ncbi:MAG: hypothetical protein AAF585_29645, partial [Verrucomicrobiota bacterium]
KSSDSASRSAVILIPLEPYMVFGKIRMLGVVALVGLGLPFQLAAEDEPEGELKEPREGDEIPVDQIVLEGRSRDLPDGWGLYSFTQDAPSREKKGIYPGLFPHGPITPNRRFEYEGMKGKHPGGMWIYLYALPPSALTELARWKVEREDYIKKFGAANAPFPKRAKLFEDAKLLDEVKVKIVPKES